MRGASISDLQPPDWERTRAGIAVSGLWSCYSSLSCSLHPGCDACCRGHGAGVHCGFVAVIPWFPVAPQVTFPLRALWPLASNASWLEHPG